MVTKRVAFGEHHSKSGKPPGFFYCGDFGTWICLIGVSSDKNTDTVRALCDALKLQQPTFSHHLALLWMSALVGRKPKGKAQIYSLNRGTLEPARAFLAKMR